MAEFPADVQLHEPSRDDVEVFVPAKRQYGVVQAGGKQVIYTSREVNGGRFVIDVHPDHLTRVLRAIEGSRLANAPASAAAPSESPGMGEAPEPKVKRSRKKASA